MSATHRSAAPEWTPLEGAEIMCEVPGQDGVLLWNTLRTVRLWAAAPSKERAAELVVPGARGRRDAEIPPGDVAEELARPLRRLGALIDPSESMGGEAVAASCSEVAAWARESGGLATAAAFSEAAALASPDDPYLALQVVRDARQAGELERAESWCDRTILLGRESSNWDACSRAVLSLGIMARRRGNFPAARRIANRALRMTTRHALPEARALALHELFLIAVQCDGAQVARRYAERAHRAYGACHRELHYLSHDVCLFWLTQGQYERAHPAVRSLLPVFAERERLLAASTLVVAAAGRGDRKEFSRAWTTAAQLLEWRQGYGSVSGALLAMARGATGVGEWELARTMAERARSVGEEKGEWNVVFAAERTAACTRERRSALPAAR